MYQREGTGDLLSGASQFFVLLGHWISVTFVKQAPGWKADRLGAHLSLKGIWLDALSDRLCSSAVTSDTPKDRMPCWRCMNLQARKLVITSFRKPSQTPPTLREFLAHFLHREFASQPVTPALEAEAGKPGVQGQPGLPVKKPVSKPKQLQNSTNVLEGWVLHDQGNQRNDPVSVPGLLWCLTPQTHSLCMTSSDSHARQVWLQSTLRRPFFFLFPQLLPRQSTHSLFKGSSPLLFESQDTCFHTHCPSDTMTLHLGPRHRSF